MKETRAEHLAVEKLRPFDGHPFKVVDNEEMDQLTWSILTQGLLTPLVVRPLDNGEYEVISGHRRLHACKKAAIETVPALIYAIDRDAEAIALVDSNLQREHILPSEKAYAYKLKAEAMKRYGKPNLGNVVPDYDSTRTTAEIGEASGESYKTVQRYIRLTNLIPGVLQKVDEGRIALTPAVELSYLTEWEQRDLLETMESEDCTPSLSQAIQMKALSQSGQLDMDTIFHIMTQPKANQQEKISFKVSELRDFFPRHYTAAQMMQEIKVALKERQQRLARQRDHSR